MSKDDAQQLLDALVRRDRVRASSLVMSFFGDAVLPRGGRIWLGSMIRLLAPLGLNERLVRTTVFRLNQEEWLQVESVGRRSNYLLPPAGAHRFNEASQHIYSSAMPKWDGRWRLIVCVGDMALKDKLALRRALLWQGFGTVGNESGSGNGTCFIHPGADLSAVFEALVDEGMARLLPGLKPLIAAQMPTVDSSSDVVLARTAWRLDNLADAYADFVKKYQAVLASARSCDEIDGQCAFLLRTMLIHDYRRLLLRDPNLPAALLPTNWSGLKARLLCQEIYRRLLPLSEQYLDQHFLLADGRVTRANVALHRRFL